MVTIAEYAKSRGISRQAAGRTVGKYAEELAGHITQVGNCRYLDDEAVRILDEHRQPQPLAVLNADQAAKLEELEAENGRLRMKLEQVQDMVIGLQGQLLEAGQAAAQLPAAQEEIDRLRNELEEARRPWWRRWRR